MENINITKENLESLNSINFKNLDKNILSEIINLLIRINFKNIDFDNSTIEFETEFKKEYIYFKLFSKKCISIEITLYEDFIDMEVANNQSIYEMYKIIDIKNEMCFLSKWINSKIINKTKYSGNMIVCSKFYDNQNINKILFKNSSLFSFLSFKSNETIYNSWIE